MLHIVSNKSSDNFDEHISDSFLSAWLHAISNSYHNTRWENNNIFSL